MKSESTFNDFKIEPNVYYYRNYEVENNKKIEFYKSHSVSNLNSNIIKKDFFISTIVSEKSFNDENVYVVSNNRIFTTELTVEELGVLKPNNSYAFGMFIKCNVGLDVDIKLSLEVSGSYITEICVPIVNKLNEWIYVEAKFNYYKMFEKLHSVKLIFKIY